MNKQQPIHLFSPEWLELEKQTFEEWSNDPELGVQSAEEHQHYCRLVQVGSELSDQLRNLPESVSWKGREELWNKYQEVEAERKAFMHYSAQ